MTRRTIFIILAALIFVALVLLAWYWLFSQGSSVTGGLFGTAGNRTGTTTAQFGQSTNIQTTIPGGTNAGSGSLGTGGVGSGGGGTNVPLNSGGTVGTVGSVGSVSNGGVGVATVPGVDWLGGSSAGGGSGASLSTFSPTSINQLNGGATGGKVTIFGTPPTPQNNNDLSGLFTGAGIAVGLCTVGFLTSNVLSLPTTATANSGVPIAAANIIPSVPVNDKGTQAILTAQLSTGNQLSANSNYKQTFLDCLARTIGRAIVNQITASVINWINGGFKGQPSFVQNYQQFFANVSNLAAGAYIQGSALSFLCSPFQLQIKLAIAQSYARNGAQISCSLTSVTNNINSFINGNFNAGGWPALLSLTSMPTNNPYGAYAYAQIGLANAQTQALNNANRNITPGGFISYAQTYNCTSSASAQNGQYINNSQLFLSPAQAAAGTSVPGCQTRIVTPGSVIESSLVNTTNGSADMIRQLGISGSFDAILSALITQLMTQTLQNGLSNLSGTQGYASNFLTPDQQQAQKKGNDLLVTLQAAQQAATQYGQTEQGSISDIQNTQRQMETLSNCWEGIASGSNYTPSQQTQAAQQASSTQDSIAALEAQVAVHNNNITRANAAIAALQTLQTQTLSVTSSGDVSKIQDEFSAAAASGQLIAGADVTQAQQDRTTLQSQLAAQNANTAASLTQCQAITPTP